MYRILYAVSMLALFATLANAQTAPTTSPSWTDVQRACGTEYRETKGQADRKTWPAFLAECRDRKGFVPKRAARTDFRLPDVNKQ